MAADQDNDDPNACGLHIVTINQTFKEEDGDWEFSHSKIILKDDGGFYYADSKDRHAKAEQLDLSKLDIKPIPRLHIYPILPQQAPHPLPENTFIKRPCLLSYGDTKNLTEISDLVMHEARMCELIRRSPHPNVAEYYGCEVDRSGMITGLCFKRYHKTLDQAIEDNDCVDKAECLSHLRRGIEHLHSLEIIHCDINPRNIFIDGSTFVIGDFDSCAFEGTEMGMKRGTDGWTNVNFTLARRENDWYGYRKIEEFLPDRGR